jgi:hypothetical protein
MGGYEWITLLLASIGVIVAAGSAFFAIATQRQIHKETDLLQRRQAFITIWPHLASMHDIDAADVAPGRVIKNVNVLDLIATCWEGRIVDLDVIRRVFHERFIEMYETIESLPFVPALKRTGKEVLRENPAVQRLYKKLKEEKLDQGAIG